MDYQNVLKNISNQLGQKIESEVRTLNPTQAAIKGAFNRVLSKSTGLARKGTPGVLAPSTSKLHLGYSGEGEIFEFIKPNGPFKTPDYLICADLPSSEHKLFKYQSKTHLFHEVKGVSPADLVEVTQLLWRYFYPSLITGLVNPGSFWRHPKTDLNLFVQTIEEKTTQIHQLLGEYPFDDLPTTRQLKHLKDLAYGVGGRASQIDLEVTAIDGKSISHRFRGIKLLKVVGNDYIEELFEEITYSLMPDYIGHRYHYVNHILKMYIRYLKSNGHLPTVTESEIEDIDNISIPTNYASRLTSRLKSLFRDAIVI